MKITTTNLKKKKSVVQEVAITPFGSRNEGKNSIFPKTFFPFGSFVVLVNVKSRFKSNIKTKY